MKCAQVFLLSFLIALTTPLVAQQSQGNQKKESVWSTANLELGGGWVYVSGNNGLNGFNLDTALWFTRRVSVAVDYDFARDTSNLSNFGLTTAGLITIKNHLQNFLVGPRIFFPPKRVKKYELEPFGEVQVGFGHLYQQVSQVGVGSESSSSNAYSWLLGGGADYVLSQHWAARANLDLLRTHFANAGQSRFRLVLSVNYTFRKRK